MKKLFTLAIGGVFIVAMVLGNIAFGQSALANNISMPPSQPSSVYVEFLTPPKTLTQSGELSTAGDWLIAQSDTQEISEEVVEDVQEEVPGATLAEGTPVGCSEEGFYPHPGDCKKFRRCVFDPNFNSFTEYVFDCAPGTDLWCQEILTCSFAFQCPGTCSGE